MGVATASEKKRTHGEEVILVLALSLLSGTFFSIISLLDRPIAGETVALFPQSDLVLTQVMRRFVASVFGFAPVWLAIYLVRRSGEGPKALGLTRGELPKGLLWGVPLGLALALAAGLGQAATAAMGIQRFLIPVPELGHWWSVPMVVVDYLRTSFVEEVVVGAFMVHRLLQMGTKPWLVIGASAVFRGSYHLYQGFGGFFGSALLGVAFAWIFVRYRRTWVLIVAHFVLDGAASVAYLFAQGHCILGTCF